MCDTIENKILIKIKKAKRGTLFFSDNFSALGNAETTPLARFCKPCLDI